MTETPSFSIITPVYNTPEKFLRATVQSILDQSWTAWEFILIDDASPDPNTRVLLAELAAKDSRIHVIERLTNGGISNASNDGIDRATGDFIALLDHDDVLLPGALHRMAELLLSDPRIDMAYTDEDKIDDNGQHFDPFSKPEWSPSRLRSQMYLGHLLVLRTDLVRTVGGFRAQFDGSQDHDLALRVSESARRIAHLPAVLYSWRAHSSSTAGSSESKPYTWDAGVRAVNEHLARLGLDAEAVPGRWPNTADVNWRVDPETRVSVIIPTRGTRGRIGGVERTFVVEAVRSVLSHTEHEAVEFVVVYDTSTPADVLMELRQVAGDKLVLVEFAKPFNFSEKCNVGVVASSGAVIVLLNDDTEAISPKIIEQLMGPLAEPGVGMVGANLVYPDGLIQHAGHQYSENGFKHSYFQERSEWSGPFAALTIDREVSGVTGACADLTRDTYFSVGGLSEALPSNFNDVDLCFKIASAGLRILWLHRVKLYHFESKSRDNAVSQWEVDRVRSRWGRQFIDPYVRAEHTEPRPWIPSYAFERDR